MSIVLSLVPAELVPQINLNLSKTILVKKKGMKYIIGREIIFKGI